MGGNLLLQYPGEVLLRLCLNFLLDLTKIRVTLVGLWDLELGGFVGFEVGWERATLLMR